MTPMSRKFHNKGGILAGEARAIFNITGIPLLKNLSVGGTYATDLNEFAPARRLVVWR